jgi:competence protein ComEC
LAVKAKGITIKLPKAGDAMSVNGLSVAVLNPQSPPLRGNPDIDAVVVKLSTKDMCMVLLNPTVQERENALLSGKESLKCSVMTYFKHGEGRPTPSLIMDGSNKPNDVIISVGPNDLKLPSETTIMRLDINNVNVWRTDRDGTVAVISKITGGYDIGKLNATGDGVLP